MADGPPPITVAGCICLDLIPAWPPAREPLGELLRPGRLIEVGPAVTATGGAVANTGLALHRLGLAVQLMGKVGDDLFGRAILELLARNDPALAAGMIVAPGQASAYTVVLNPPGVDRIFLHCPGANNTFAADDVPYERLAGQRLFHFGYPPIMRRMHADGGSELERMLGRVKQAGLTTSLDMAHVDPASPAGSVDWAGLLRRALPRVDVFAPSVDETVAMVRPDRAAGPPDGALLSGLGRQLIDWGAAVVALKLGDQGLYLRTTDRADRLAAMGRAAPGEPAAWIGRELLAPCFEVEVAGTTGSGDCTIAGLLAGLLAGQSAEQAATSAVAVGACCVERPDATSGVLPWPRVRARIESGWLRRLVAIDLAGWRWDGERSVWLGPDDATRAG